MDQTFMKEKPVLPLVLKMALPIVLSMLINSLYNIVDSYFVAQWNESAMTAVSLVFPLQNLANAVGHRLRRGHQRGGRLLSGSGAPPRGRPRLRTRRPFERRPRRAARGAVLPLHRALPSHVTKDEMTVSYGLEYFYVVIAFSPVLTLSLAFEKILQATGKMVTTMFCMAVGAVANIILGPYLISRPRPHPRNGRHGRGARDGHRTRYLRVLLAYLIVFRRANIP